MPTAPSISLLLTPHLAHWPAENPARQLVAAAAAFALRIVQARQLEGKSALAGAEFPPLSDDAPGALVRVGIAPADAAVKGRAAWDPQPRCCTGIITPFSSRRQRLDHSFLRERLQGAQGYDRIAGFFSSSILEVAGEAVESIEGPVRRRVSGGSVHELLSERLEHIANLFGQIPDILEDLWIDLALREVDAAKKTIDAAHKQHPFPTCCCCGLPAADPRRSVPLTVRLH